MRINRTQKSDLVAQVIEARKAKDEAENRYAYLAKQLMDEMEANQQKSVSHTDGGKKYSLTYSSREITTLDEAGLKKELGAVAFNKLCKKVLDRPKVEKMLDEGQLDPMVVGKYAQTKRSAPYLRFSEKGEPDEVTG